MQPRQQSRYSQMPGAYPAEEDEESDAYQQMMDDLAEEECNKGPRQSQHSHTAGLAGRQYAYTSKMVPTQGPSYPSYPTPASHQQKFAGYESLAKWSSERVKARRQHPYARPSVPAPGTNHQTSAYETPSMRQTGPVRHGRNIPSGQGSGNSRPLSDHTEEPAQQHHSKDDAGYASPYLPAYKARSSDLSGYGPSQRNSSKAKESNEAKKPAKAKGKSKTRLRHGKLECLLESDAGVPEWVPAIRMDDCRRSLIDQQKSEAASLGMTYHDPDPAGTGKDDETAFKVEHADWGSDRAHLPAICWRYNEDEQNNPRPSRNPGYMWFENMIVLDPNDNPVKNWPQLPLTLSSKTRGYRLEIMSRENPHLEYRDFIARMPSVIEKSKKNKVTGAMEAVYEAPDPNVVCNMRMFRFRREKGLLSWTEKGKTKVIGEGLEKLFGDKLINNSMESFGRDLTPKEQAEISNGRNAHFPDLDPTGASTQATTEGRKRKGATKAPKQQSNAKAQKAMRKKRLREEYDDLDSSEDGDLAQDTAASYPKRRRNARGEASKPEVKPGKDQSRVEVRSDPTPQASNQVSNGHHHEDGEDSEDEDVDDEEYSPRTSRRPIHPLPARRTHMGEKKVQLFAPAQVQEQSHGSDGNIGSQSNAADDEDQDMTDVDGLDLDDVSSLEDELEEAVEEEEEAVEDDEEEEEQQNVVPVNVVPVNVVPQNVIPPAPQETDLERHRRVTREYLGEEDDFYWLPEAKPSWLETNLFAPIPTL